jgi:hypothetical protein
MQRPLIITSVFILVFMCVAFFIYYWAFGDLIREGMSNTYSYTPNKMHKNERKDYIHINEFIHEAALALDFIKVDNELVAKKDTTKPAVDISGEYSKTYTDLDIYKEFKPSDLTKNLDRKFGDYFEGDVVSKSDDVQIEANWNSDVDLKSYNQIYRSIYYSTINPTETYNEHKFSQYFTGLIKRYKSKKEQLGEIKHFFYSLIKPIYLSNTLFELYLKNESLYNKKDGDTKDSALFAINTVYDYLDKLPKSVEEDFTIVDKAEYVYCFKADKTDQTFSIDSIKLFQTIGILLEVKSFVEKVKNKDKINMSVEKFVSGFQTYLFKANHVSEEEQSKPANQSVLIYLLDNPITEKGR